MEGNQKRIVEKLLLLILFVLLPMSGIAQNKLSPARRAGIRDSALVYAVAAADP